jgi:hypothetical protein
MSRPPTWFLLTWAMPFFRVNVANVGFFLVANRVLVLILFEKGDE